MRTPNERIADLEEALQSLQFQLPALAAAPISSLAVVLNQLVDERKLPASTREQIWLAMEREVAEMFATAPKLLSAARAAIPNRHTRQFTPQVRAEHREMERRVRKEILRIAPAKEPRDP